MRKITLFCLIVLFAAAAGAQNTVPYPFISMEKYNNDTGASLSWWHGPDSAFIESPTYNPPLPKLKDMYVADFNGGDPDLVFFDRNNNSYKIVLDAAVQLGDYTNLGYASEYYASFYINDGNNDIRDVTVGDFNDDGVDDIAVVYYDISGATSSRVGVFSGVNYSTWAGDNPINGEGDFDHIFFMEKLDRNSEVYNIELTDIDDDNIADLIIADQGQWDAGASSYGAAVYIIHGGNWVDGDTVYTLNQADPVTSRSPVAPGTMIIIRRPYNLGISLDGDERFGENIAFDPGMDMLYISDAFKGTGDFGSGVHCLHIFDSLDYLGWTSDVEIGYPETGFDADHGDIYAYISQPAGLNYTLFMGNYGICDRIFR